MNREPRRSDVHEAQGAGLARDAAVLTTLRGAGQASDAANHGQPVVAGHGLMNIAALASRLDQRATGRLVRPHIFPSTKSTSWIACVRWKYQGAKPENTNAPFSRPW